MSAGDGLVVILPSRAGSAPLWWKFADGHVVSRSESGARAGMEAEGGGDGPVMLVLPTDATTLRTVALDSAMPPAQARTVALRLAREASLTPAEGLHAVAMEGEDAGQGAQAVAVIARDDLAHFIAWAREHGLDPDIILPAGALLPEPGEGFAGACMGGAMVIRGQGICADADEDWVRALIGDASVRMLNSAEFERALSEALVHPPVNLRTGEFAKRLRSDLDAALLRRMAIWVGLIALASLLISLALIARYHWSAAKLDRETLAAAQAVLPAANDAVLAQEELDRMLAQRGGGAMFTGPVAGLMSAMQGVPAVSLTALSLGDDRLVHATLASARADDINTVLLAWQAAGYSITATSSADPSGRVIAEIAVKP